MEWLPGNHSRYYEVSWFNIKNAKWSQFTPWIVLGKYQRLSIKATVSGFCPYVRHCSFKACCHWYHYLLQLWNKGISSPKSRTDCIIIIVAFISAKGNSSQSYNLLQIVINQNNFYIIITLFIYQPVEIPFLATLYLLLLYLIVFH